MTKLAGTYRIQSLLPFNIKSEENTVDVFNIKSIEEANSFDEISEIRELTYNINKANGFDLESLLTGGYKDPTHFIYELIQNAEDAKATVVEFKLEKNRLIFSHNGSKHFDLNDIKAITGIGNSTKKIVDNKDRPIGKFGIGFKSVFKICKVPEIFSEDFCFKIEHLYVPKRIEKSLEYIGKTYFVLAFYGNEDEISSTYQIVHDALVNFSSDTILFLRNINEINCAVDENTFKLKRDKKHKSFNQFDYFECDIKRNDRTENSYLFFERPLSMDNKLYVSIAYKVSNEDNKKIIMEENTTKLVVFFPMDGVETFLHFKVNGPYATTNTRDNLSVELNNKEANSNIIKETVDLYTDSLRCIKSMGLFTIDVFNKLPIDKSLSLKDDLPLSFYYATLKLMKEESFLPTNSNSCTCPKEALLVGSKDLIDLLDESDLAMLFGEPKVWLDASITKSNSATSRIYGYIKDLLGVNDIDTNYFLRRVGDSFFASKNDGWLIKFYKLFTGQSNIKNYLNKAFIRLENGGMSAPFMDDIPLVFLPRPNSKRTSKYIKSSLCNDKDALDFFEFIGISAANIVDDIREFMDILEKSKDLDDYVLNMQLIFDEYNSANEENKEKIIKILKKEKCILCETLSDSGKYVYVNPSNAFICTENLVALYEGIEGIYFVVNDILNNLDYEFQNFLVKLGVHSSLKLVQLNFPTYVSSKYKGLTNAERDNLMGNSKWTTYEESGYQIENLNNILLNITKEKSVKLWVEIGKIESVYFDGILQWRYSRSRNEVKFDGYFLRTLQNAKWLFDNNGNKIAPSEIFLEDVKSIYPDSILFKRLKFKPDARKSLSVDDQNRLNITDGIPIDILQQFREQYLETIDSGEFIPEVSPDDCEAEVQEAAFVNPRKGVDEQDLLKKSLDEDKSKEELTDIITDFYGSSKGVIVSDSHSDYKISSGSNCKTKQEIGLWGEKLVIKKLKERFNKKGYSVEEESSSITRVSNDFDCFTIEHLNSKYDVQEGFDIAIKEGDEIVEYIEVKSSESEDKEYFEISGTQWEFCKTLELKYKQGDKYYVYRVLGAGKSTARIIVYQNPYKKWVEGDVDAHPVRIKF